MGDRRYTTAELDAMEQQAVSQGMNPEAAQQASGELSSGVEGGEDFTGGFGASLKRTLLGLEQAKEYLVGDDAGRTKVNEAIKTLEAHPALQTPMGKLGDAAGTAAQFMGPQGAASVGGKLAPLAAVKAARLLIREPGSIGRAALQGGAFEATQPVSPSDAGTDEYLMQKGGRIAAGAGGAATVGKVGKMLTSPGVPMLPSRGPVVNEAQRLGINLTPAQRTGDMMLSQYEEGLASRPGSANLIDTQRKAQQGVLNKTAAEAIGSREAAPTEKVLADQYALARKGYEPVASIPKMAPDLPYFDELESFAKRQATKATGSADAAAVAMRLKAGSSKQTGSGFLEELQGVRDMAYGARQKGDVATAEQLNDLHDIMENFAERKVAVLAKKGLVPADAMDQLRKSRTDIAKIRAIESAVDPITGKVSPLKYLSQEFKRQPARKGPGTSPVSEGLRNVGDVARVLKQVQPYIGSSGTAERIGGQQMVDASTGLFSALRTAGPLAKNYLAAKLYLAHGGRPGPLGASLNNMQNMYVRRMLPGAAFATTEGLTE